MSWFGIGSASVVLVFAVLCLTIFTVISYVTAVNEQNLTAAEVRLVKAYYAADAAAESILAEILYNFSNKTPISNQSTACYYSKASASNQGIAGSIMGIEVTSFWDWNILADLVSFSYPITESTELFVEVAIGEFEYEILTWRIRRTKEWQPDSRLNVWQLETEG